jgi:hypothetical protein
MTLYEFTGGTDGGQPIDVPVLDSSGKVYGTASAGGSSTATCSPYCGTVFELVPPAPSSGTWSEITLYSFQAGNDGYAPAGSPLLGRRGVIYGTTSSGGGAADVGAVYEVTP